MTYNNSFLFPPFIDAALSTHVTALDCVWHILLPSPLLDFCVPYTPQVGSKCNGIPVSDSVSAVILHATKEAEEEEAWDSG